MNGPIRRVAFTLFAMFGLLLSAVTYSQVIKGPNYRDDPRNVRVVAGRAGRASGEQSSLRMGWSLHSRCRTPTTPGSFGAPIPKPKRMATLLDTRRFSSEIPHWKNRRPPFSSPIAIPLSRVSSTALLGGDLRPGGLRLTFDHRLQTAAIAAMGDQRGAIVTMDPTTGAILALVSTPGFDPNELLGTSPLAGDDLAASAEQPLLNRAIAMSYPPGSTFKIVTATAALESGAAGPGTTYPNPVELTLPGSTSTIRNFDRRRCGSSATISLAEAFAVSCNTTFGMIGLELDPGDLVDAAGSFGFGLDVPFEFETLISVMPPASSFADDAPALAQSAIGQRDVRVTPLQMALVAAGVANGGWIMSPYLISEEFNSDGVVTASTSPVGWQRAMSPSTADVLADLMERVVTSGTGSRAAVPGIRIAGKTGTAEVPDEAPHAWFVGFGPVGARPGTPQIAIAVLVESGGDLGDNGDGRDCRGSHRAGGAFGLLRRVKSTEFQSWILDLGSLPREPTHGPGTFNPGAERIIPALHRYHSAP